MALTAKQLKRRKALRQEVKGVLFVLPAFIFLAMFTLYPMINAAVTSLYNWSLGGRKKYIGLYNYQKMFKADIIWTALGNTLQYVLWILPITLVVGFLLAILIQKNTRHNVAFRTMIFAPHVCSMVGLSVVWLHIYNPQYGMLNALFNMVGLPSFRWVNDSSTALLSIVIVTVWRMLGYSVVVYLGGIQNISQEILEAAHIDGANRRQTTWRVVMPLVSPTTFMLLILNTISVMKLFTTIENMTNGGPGTATTNLIMVLYEFAFRKYQTGYASAIAVLLFVLIFAINMLQRTLERFVTYDQ